MMSRGDGEIDAVVYFGSEQYASNDTNLAVELSDDIWHTVIALAEPAVLLELKSGPFNPAVAKEPASWAPVEGSFESQAYFKKLQAECGLLPPVQSKPQ